VVILGCGGIEMTVRKNAPGSDQGSEGTLNDNMGITIFKPLGQPLSAHCGILNLTTSNRSKYLKDLEAGGYVELISFKGWEIRIAGSV
jgi:hypothetical protein